MGTCRAHFRGRRVLAGAGVGSEGRALEGLSESEGAEEEEEERAREQPG